MNENQSAQKANWERETIEKLLFSVLKEQKANRRWKIFFRVIIFTIIFIILALIFTNRSKQKIHDHTAVINIRGIIMDEGKTDAKSTIQSLTAAFNNQHSKGIILYINSGGGSPVQSSDIYDAIMSLKKSYPNKKVYAVCSDICASGAYYIASAADEIYANKSSIVGSIGVLMNGFGFVGSMEKLGIQRRLFTAGSEKGFLDPFSSLKQENVAHLKHMLNIIHQQFINSVKAGRSDRLKNDPDLFSGLMWTGEQALTLGLIDGFGNSQYIAQELIKQKEIINYTHHGDFLKQLSQNIGSQTAVSIADMVGIKPTLLY